MRKIFLILVLIPITLLFSFCKKNTYIDEEKQDRKVFYAASLIPVKIDVDKNLKGTVHFKTVDRSYFIMLDDIKANANLNIILDAINEEKLLKIYMYQNSFEIAKLER